MDYKNIIEKGKLIYASRPEDRNFRLWRLNKTACYVQCYHTLELTKLDKVVLMTLKFNDKKLYEDQLARILGFNVKDDFIVTPKRYKDNGEISIFNGIIDELNQYGLISKDDDKKIYMSPLGELALKKGVKYEFYSGAILLNESFDLAQKEDEKFLFFPFRDSLGIVSKIQGAKLLSYNDINVNNIEDILYGEPELLTARLLLQTDDKTAIFQAEASSEARMGEAYIDFRLYELDGNKYPLIFYKDELSLKTNELLFDKRNERIVNEKIHIGEYLYLVRESKKELTYDSLSPYMDVWDLDDFLDSSLLKWDDLQLFDSIAKEANGSQWNKISSFCPTESLIPHLKEYEESLDWIILSERYDDDFIVTNATIYPWDFESLSTSRDIEFVKRLIIIPELHNDKFDWDWEIILPKLDDEFVLNNMSTIPFVMFTQTDRFLTQYPEVILNYPERTWDWVYISQNGDLQILLDNIASLSKFVYVEDIMPRAFTNDLLAQQYCDSSAFAFAVLESKDRLGDTYNANTSNYKWSEKLINWHETMDFISWKSVGYSIGFECNPHLEWTPAFFETFKNKDFSIKGFNHISEKITDTASIDQNPDFKWSWSILSKRDIVLSNIDFIKGHLSQLSLDVILPSLKTDYIDQLYSYKEFKPVASSKKLWPIITEKVSEDIIRKNYSDSNWDWKVLTKRFCTSLNIKQLGDARWVDKLDWDYLSENLDNKIIQDNLSLYSSRWNWHNITLRVDHDFLISDLTEHYKYWDWFILLNTRLSNEDLADVNIRNQIAIILPLLNEDNEEGEINNRDKEENRVRLLWTLFTRRFKTEDILSFLYSPSLNTVAYSWDYKDVYNRTDFELKTYLDNYLSIGYDIDWDALSSSKALDKILRWDKKITKKFRDWEDFVISILENSDFHWNFKYLSSLSSINWCDNILQVRSEEWDWAYLSEHSLCFSYNSKKAKELIKHIEKFDTHLDFAILSKRKDVKLDLETLNQHLSYPWDWAAVSNNRSIELSETFVSEHIDYPWDWKALSSRYDCNFTIEFIQENKNKDWDWQALSHRKEIKFNTTNLITLCQKDWDWNELMRRKDIEPSAELLRLVIDKDINWKALSQRDDFYPSLEVLKILKEKDIDWSGISRREELAYNVILLYKDKLDWKILSHSSHIDISKTNVLETFKDYLDWNYISNSSNFYLSVENLEKFQDKLNWIVLCKRRDFNITEEILERFASKLDWATISRSGIITFTQELVDKFRDRWDWVALSENPSFRNSGVETTFKKELNLMEFYNELKQYRRTPYIYHFTHLFNAVEVIRTQKILSRNRAQELGLLKYDAAGSVVNRSAKAHPYARFYYRTGTQTQFYNECLGKDRTMKYYDRALTNGLPMCPMPVFFKFNLQEVLTKHASQCYYSTGNMQTNWARIYRVIDDPFNIDACNLYSSGYQKVVREKKQQEFLVKNEFDFSDLNDFQIICYDREQADILLHIFRGNPICEHIYAVYDTENVYEGNNPPLRFERSNSALKVNTRYKGDYIFQIESDNISKIHVFNTKDIKVEKRNVIQLYNSVSVELNETPFDVYYVNMSPAARSPRWLIYQHIPVVREVRYTKTEDIEKYLGISFDDDEFSPEELITSLELALPKLEDLYNTRVRHYVVKQHTLLVCQQFEKYAFEFNYKIMNVDLMRLILAMHDVGKAIDRSTQHEHTLDLIREFWKNSPFTDYELKMAEAILKDDHLGKYFQGKYDITALKEEIETDAELLQIDSSSLLRLKMILYQCDIASYTKDAGGLKYLEKMFVYNDGEKSFDDEEGLLEMSPEYWNRYIELKTAIYE